MTSDVNTPLILLTHILARQAAREYLANSGRESDQTTPNPPITVEEASDAP